MKKIDLKEMVQDRESLRIQDLLAPIPSSKATSESKSLTNEYFQLIKPT